MDPTRFDALARSLAARLPRRAALGAGLAGLLGLAAPDAAGAKCSRERPCPPCKRCKQGTCRKKRDGTPCAGGTCRGGRCVGGGSCAPTGDGGASLVVQSRFAGKDLRLQHATDPAGPGGEGATLAEVTLGGESVLRIQTEVAGPGVVTTVTYGAAFRGIRQARFTTDGQTTEGEIDGRPIRPLAADADPGQVRFADGGPPLEVRADPELTKAVRALFGQAEQAAAGCAEAARAGRASARDASSSPECIALQAACGIEMASCMYGVAKGTAACALLSTFTFGLAGVVCGVVGTGICGYQLAKCTRNTKYGSTCCPVRCGGDVDDLFGADPLCCEEGQACLDPSSNRPGGCCRNGTVGCGGVCCPTSSCIRGIPGVFPDFCCGGETGARCGNQCCGGLDKCCNNTTCCAGACIGSNCCPSPNFVCGGTCCPSGRACCNNRTVCCGPDQVCDANDRCKTPTTCAFVCNGQCCQSGDVCCGGVRCEPRAVCPN